MKKEVYYNSSQSAMEELKPLVVLFLEQYGTRDSRGKPLLDMTRVSQIEDAFIRSGGRQEDWHLLLGEFGNTSLKNTRKVRDHLAHVKEPPDITGNIYANKQKILEKIEEIMRGFL